MPSTSDPSHDAANSILGLGCSCVLPADKTKHSAVTGVPLPVSVHDEEAGGIGSSLEWTLCQNSVELSTALQ